MAQDGTERPQPEDRSMADVQKGLEGLPTELRTTVTNFFRNLTSNIIAQQTHVDGQDVSIKVTPDQQTFYEDQFKEILESDLLNPHVSPKKKIS